MKFIFIIFNTLIFSPDINYSIFWIPIQKNELAFAFRLNNGFLPSLTFLFFPDRQEYFSLGRRVLNSARVLRIFSNAP